MSLTHTNLAVVQTVIAGGAAGDLTVTGIKPRDVLKSVLHLEVGAAVGIDGVADLTSEFSITAVNTINNAGGTASTNGFLVILYLAASDLGDDLNRN